MIRRRGWRVAAWLVAAAASGWGAAQGCVAVPGGGTVTVAGVGRIVFQELTTDRARDAASFGGEVCVLLEGSDIVFRTARLEVSGLGGDAHLSTGDVTVEVPGWTLTAAAMRGDALGVALEDVAIAGQDALGRASRVAIDLVAGGVAAEDLRLITVSARLDAAEARLDGTVLEARQARLSSCACAPDAAPVRVEAATARFDVAATRAVLDGAAVVVGRLRWSLADATTIDAQTLASLVLPVRLAPDPDQAGAWRLGIVASPVAPGVTAEAWVTTPTETVPARAAVAAEGHAGARSFGLVVATDGVAFEADGTWPLAAGWRVRGTQRVEAGAIEAAVRDATVRVERPWSGTAAALTWSGELGVEAAVTAQSLASGEVAGPRLALDGALEARWRAGPALVGVALAGGATGYPEQARSQTWWSVAPRWALASDGLDLVLRHDARWVRGASPFDERVDRVVPQQRTHANLTWAPGTLGSWRPSVAANVRVDWTADPARPGRPIGLERFTVRLAASTALAGGTLDLAWVVEAAGRLDPRPDRDASVAARATWTRDGLELGVRTTFGLAGDVGWRDVTVFAAVPWQVTPEWLLRPYAAVDVHALVAADGPWLRGHGLEVVWSTCCGTVEAGYRVDDVTGTRATFAVALPVRPLDPARLRADGGAGSSATTASR